MRDITTIAEIGINHGGDFAKAMRMTRKAYEAGADIIKFQHYRPAEILGENSPYIRQAIQSQLSLNQLSAIKEYCDGLGVEWGCSLFHPEHVDWAEKIGMRRYKIASRTALNLEFLRVVAKTIKPVILSTGICWPDDIKRALEILGGDVTLMYCVCRYPASVKEMNMKDFVNLFSYRKKLGISSHCPHIAPTLAAVALGAEVIEHHVKESADDCGPDMTSSLTFDEFNALTTHIRDMELIPC